MKIIRIATRKSMLALWQAEHVGKLITQINPDCKIELIKITTSGDKFLEKPLIDIGGKGLFLKELEEAIMEGKADIAVHSVKDVPYELPKGLHMPVILKRGNIADAFVSNIANNIYELPENSIIGTASLRRSAQLKILRPDCQFVPVRGNVQTRLAKLDSREYDALILAAAGLIRLELTNRITSYLSKEECLPAVGQGAIGIECKIDAHGILRVISKLNDSLTADCIIAERSMNAKLNGSCHTPIAASASIENGVLTLDGLVATLDGKICLKVQAKGYRHQALEIGKDVAAKLIEQGAKKIIENR